MWDKNRLWLRVDVNSTKRLCRVRRGKLAVRQIYTLCAIRWFHGEADEIGEARLIDGVDYPIIAVEVTAMDLRHKILAARARGFEDYENGRSFVVRWAWQGDSTLPIDVMDIEEFAGGSENWRMVVTVGDLVSERFGDKEKWG